MKASVARREDREKLSTTIPFRAHAATRAAFPSPVSQAAARSRFIKLLPGRATPTKPAKETQYTGSVIARRSAEEASPARTVMLVAWLRMPLGNLGAQNGEGASAGDASA